MSYSRRTIENPSDRAQLEIALARELYSTWETTKTKVLTRQRIEFIERRYGRGSVDRVKAYMNMFRNGELQ